MVADKIAEYVAGAVERAGDLICRGVDKIDQWVYPDEIPGADEFSQRIAEVTYQRFHKALEEQKHAEIKKEYEEVGKWAKELAGKYAYVENPQQYLWALVAHRVYRLYRAVGLEPNLNVLVKEAYELMGMGGGQKGAQEGQA